jgi:hypothetical protein
MQSRCLSQRFFLCGFTEIDFRFISALGSFFDVPLSIFRSGVLRQGSDKFYSVSFQARLSFWVYFLEFLARLKANLVTNFSFPP